MADWEPAQTRSRGEWRDHLSYYDRLYEEGLQRRMERRREYLLEYFGVETAAEAVRKWTRGIGDPVSHAGSIDPAMSASQPDANPAEHGA